MSVTFNPFTGNFDFTYSEAEGDARYLKLDPNINDTSHYTGFPNRTDTSLSWDNASYTLTLTDLGSAYVMIDGIQYYLGGNLTCQLSVAQEAATALYWFWITQSGGTLTLNASDTAPGFDKCLVANMYWNTETSQGIGGDERHWMGRDQKMHEYLHETFGARYYQGMAGTFDNTTFTIGAGEFYDEDIEHTNSETTSARILYHNGSDAWAWDNNITTPYKVVNPGVDNTLRYNDGTSLASVSNNHYTNYWVFITNNVNYPVVIILGTDEFTNVAGADAEVAPSLGALPLAEMKLIYKITYQNVGGTPTYTRATDYRTAQVSANSGYVATDHGSLSGLTDDDHPQYDLKARTRYIQLDGDLHGLFATSATKKLPYVDYGYGITITNILVQCSVADPTTELAADIKYCDAQGSGAFPAANATVVKAIDTTTGNYDSGAITEAVATGKTLYLSMDSDPTDTETMWTITITYTSKLS